MRTTLLRTGVAMITTALLVAGCGGNDTTSNGSSGPAQQPSHNQQDILFAQQMIPHHQQALDMAKLAPSRGKNAKVLDLATRVEKAQDPEIRQMRGWLTQWNAEPPTSSIPGMGHGGGSMPGMMTAHEMSQLEQATGADFDRMWMDMMIKHHQGAIDMARTELDKGANPAAKNLAQKIIDAQQAEITEMQGLLKSS